MQPKRFVCLDILKVIMSFMVVLIHGRPFIKLNPALNTFTSEGIFRIAVPIFFICNGFFLKTDKDKFKNWLFKNLKIYILLTLLFAFTWTGSIHSIMDLIKIGTTKFLYGSYHLWYFPAYILSGIIIFIFKDHIKVLTIISIILFILGCTAHNLIVYNSSVFNFFKSLPLHRGAYYYRNFLTIGLPFVAIGYCIKQFDIKLKSGAILFLLSLLLFLSEIYFQYLHIPVSFINDIHLEMYFSLLLICPVIFMFALRINIESINFTDNISSYIYFFHPIFLFLFIDSSSALTQTIKALFCTILMAIVIALTLPKPNNYLHKV